MTIRQDFGNDERRLYKKTSFDFGCSSLKEFQEIIGGWSVLIQQIIEMVWLANFTQFQPYSCSME